VGQGFVWARSIRQLLPLQLSVIVVLGLGACGAMAKRKRGNEPGIGKNSYSGRALVWCMSHVSVRRSCRRRGQGCTRR